MEKHFKNVLHINPAVVAVWALSFPAVRILFEREPLLEKQQKPFLKYYVGIYQ